MTFLNIGKRLMGISVALKDLSVLCRMPEMRQPQCKHEAHHAGHDDGFDPLPKPAPPENPIPAGAKAWNVLPGS